MGETKPIEVRITKEEYNHLLNDSKTLETLVKVLKRNGIDPVDILIKDTKNIISNVSEILKVPEKTLCVFAYEGDK